MSPSSKRGSRRQQRSAAPPARVADDQVEDEVDDIGDDIGDDEAEDGEDGFYVAPPARYEKLGAGAGVVYALVGFIGSSLLPVAKVSPEDTATAIAKELVARRGSVSAGLLLTMLSVFFFLVFLSCLHRWLRDVEGEGGWFATLALVGGVLMAGMLLVEVMLAIASTVLASYGDDPVIARTILVFEWQAIAVVFIPAAAFIGGTGLVGYTTGALPRWLAISGLVIGVGLLVPPLAFLPYLLSTLWTGMLAIFLLQRTRFGF